MLCLSIFALGGTVPTALAQFHGESVYGDDGQQFSPSIATRPNAPPIIVGNTTSGIFPIRTRPFSFEESEFGLNANVTGYDFGNGPLRMLAAANSSSNTRVGVAGTCRPPTATLDDAFFTDVSSNIDDNLQQMVVFPVAGTDRPSKIIELQDNSFVMVGSNTLGSVGTSWITRISARPNYTPIFYRTIGSAQGPSSVGEGAVAVVQPNSNALLVAGNTLQFSTGTEGAIYIAEMNLSGGVKTFHTYTMQSGVLAPRVTDMVLMPNGSLTLVGQTNISGDPDHFGFVMQVSADLSSATFTEVKQIGVTDRGQVFSAVTLGPGTSDLYIAGMIQLPDGGTIKQSGLMLKVVPPFSPQLANAYDFFGGNEAFFDILFRDNGNTVEAVGTADELPPNFFGPEGSNIWTQRLNDDLVACRTTSVALQFETKNVVHAIVSPANAASSPGKSATLALSVNPLKTFFPCNVSPRLAGSVPSKPAGVAIAQNPTRHLATVLFDEEVDRAQVSLRDATGRVLSQWIMNGQALDMDLDGMAAGLYMVGVRQGNFTSTHKLQIQ